MSDKKKRAPKKVAINYQNGKIYKIVNDINDMIYIGSTTQTLSQRLSQHRRSHNTNRFHTAMKTNGAEHFRIILVELFPCTCTAELEAREYAVMDGFAREKLYNSVVNGKHDEASRAKMSKHWTGKLGDASNTFKRGCISLNGARFQYIWSVNGKSTSKSFNFGAYSKMTREEAHQACIAFQDQTYPPKNE